jgi:hypothetical protein
VNSLANGGGGIDISDIYPVNGVGGVSINKKQKTR